MFPTRPVDVFVIARNRLHPVLKTNKCICFNLFSVIAGVVNMVIISVSLCYTGKKYPINWVKKTYLLLWTADLMADLMSKREHI